VCVCVCVCVYVCVCIGLCHPGAFAASGDRGARVRGPKRLPVRLHYRTCHRCADGHSHSGRGHLVSEHA
jgi:hypothetical protein